MSTRPSRHGRTVTPSPGPDADAPVRTLVVACPDWPVLAAGARPDVPAAVVRANRVLATSPAARADGVEVGHRRREAQGRCPGLEVLEHDPGRDARAFEAVAGALERFTPRIELSRPGLAAFPTRGPSRYFGGDVALAEAVAAAVDGVVVGAGWPGSAGVGVADGAFTARHAAEPGRVTVVERGGSPAHLAPLPVAVLDRAELADVLVRLGLRTLGAFATLDPADVVARFGADGRTAHRLARGLDERPPATAPPPLHLEVSSELDPPAERVDVAAFVAKGLADELHRRLEGEGLACTRVCVLAETEHGERIERVWRHEGALGAGAVADRVRWQLDGWLNGPAAMRPTSGVTRLVLTPDEVMAATGRQLGFWGGETAADERAGRALARVQGLLGAEAVVVPELRGGRGPGERVARVPAATIDLTADRGSAPGAEAPWPGRVPTPTPALVPAEPWPVEVLDAEGVRLGVSGRGHLSASPARVALGRGEPVDVVAWAGPWPVDERWWDPEGRRRRARLQLQLADGRALLVHVEGGDWAAEGVYD
jgi:protein ImuB